MQLQKRGLNSFQMKLLALIFMTFDHYAYFMGSISPVPDWFHIIGRLSAPLFIFICANGFYYTHSKEKYMFRLYLFSVLMEMGNQIANLYFPHPEGAMVVNSIFGTMFYIVFYLYSIEALRRKKREGRIGAVIKWGLILCFPILISALQLVLVNGLAEHPNWLLAFRAYMILLPSPLFVEGSLIWIGMGVGFYYCLNHKIRLTVFYSLISGFFFVNAVSAGITVENLFLLNSQWLMILALPFLLFYNKQRGRKMKYFFYLYYPLHIYALLGLARMVG